jgi:type I restriction enzyme S subunit
MVIKSGYKQTEVGVIPEDWGLFTLSELCNQITDGSHFSPEPQVIGKIIVNVKDIIDGRIEIDNCTNISNADFDSLVRNGCSPKPGDILLSKDGSIGEVVVYYLNIRVVCLSSIAILTPDKNKLNSNY